MKLTKRNATKVRKENVYTMRNEKREPRARH